MKKKIAVFAVVSLAALLLPGCVAFPPLIQVEHKESASNADLLKRLDAIDHRLDQLEQQRAEKKP